MELATITGFFVKILENNNNLDYIRVYKFDYFTNDFGNILHYFQ